MATNQFINASAEVGITDTTIYKCPSAVAGTSAVVFSSYLANKDGTEIVNITVKVYDASGAILRTITGKDTPINVGATLVLDKISLEEDDEVRVAASKANSVDAFFSILLVTPDA